MPSDAPRCPLDATGDELVTIFRRTFQLPRPDGSLPRTFHELEHACLDGVFTVTPPADPALAQGLFARPGRYPALVRFSGGLLPDERLPDARGMAIALSDVEGEVCEGAVPGRQDFVMVDQSTPPMRDAADALVLFRAIDGHLKPTLARMLLPGAVMPRGRPRLHYLQMMADTLRNHLKGRDLAGRTYHSVAPFALGQGAMKFQCRPDAAWRNVRGGSFAERLRKAFARGPIGFDFLIQPRQGEHELLDDGIARWTGPFTAVARLELPPQPVVADRGRDTAFTPWNALAAHRPLGELNRLRRVTYAESAARRGAARRGASQT